jgi:hypothetical protein
MTLHSRVGQKESSKTYSNGDSLVVTHLTTSPSVGSLSSVSGRGLEYSATYGRMC